MSEPVARDGGEAPVTSEEIREGSVLAVGVSSAVLEADAPEAGDVVAASITDPASAAGGVPEAVDDLARQRRRALAFDVPGHVLLLDYDDGATYADVRAEAGRFDGVTAILESSTGSFHVWNLTVRDLDDQLLTALRTGSDAMHVQQSAKRGRFILRCGPKFRIDDEGRPTERYKPAPEVVDVWATPTEEPTSEPHLRLLEALIDEQGSDLEVDRDAVDGVGERVIRSEYLTMDDSTKRRGL